MTTFTLNDIEFGARQTEAKNIVWFVDYPERITSYPRSFDFEWIAEALMQDYDVNQ